MMTIEANKLNHATVVNSDTTQLDPEKSSVGGSLTRTSNVQKGVNSALPLKPANEKAIATTPDDLAAAGKRAMSKTKPETTATNQSEVGKEYRAKRFNVQTPSIDKSQVDTLVSMVKKLKELKGNNALSTHESPKFYALVSKLETLSETIATHNNNGDFKNWIQADIPKKKDGAVSKVLKRAVGVSTQTKEGEVGSRQKAQSLTRRLEATLQGLLGVSRALMSITEHPSTEVIKQVVDQGMDEVEDDPQSAAYKRLREERIATTQDKLAQECAEALNSAEHEITKTKQRHSQRKHFSHEGAESFFKQASQVFKNALPHLSNRQPVSDKQRFHLMELRLQHEVEKLKENANEQTSTKLLVTAAEKLLKSTISQSIVWDGKVDESKSLINRELKGYLTGTLSTLCSVAEQLNSFAEYPDDAALTRKAEAQIRQEKETPEGQAWQTELDNKVSTLKSANQWKLNQTRKAVSRQIEVLAHIKAPKSKEFYSDILGSLVQIENQLPKESDRSVVSKVKDTWVSTQEDASKGISQLEQKFPATLNAAQAKLTSIIGASQKDRQTLQEKVLDSAVRTVLESLQRPAIKLQEPSQSLHTLVKELKGIEGELKYHEAHTSSHGSETNKQADDLIKQESPKALKLAALSQLLDKRTQSARDAITRQLPNDLPSAFNRDNLESHQAELTQIMQDKLWTQVSTAIHSLLKQESVEEKHHERIKKQLDDAYKTSFKTVADELVKSMIDLQKSVQAAEKRSFSDADHFSSLSSARTQKMTASLANQSATIKGRPTLDNKSVGAFLARHWAEQIQSELKLSPEDPLPEEGKVHTLLEEQGILDESILSHGDPKGFLMASRVVQELDNARRGELVHPMSPQESAEMEKGLIDFMVSWGQKRLSRGAPELIIEAVTDLPTACTFNIFSPLYRVPIAAIKVPYSVHKTSSLNRPEQDKPYKAINVMLEKKLKQLGFQIITSPLPTVAKVGLGGALAVGGMAYNAKVKEQESSLDSIHGRHVNGDKSKQLKIDSYASMAGRLVFGAPGLVSEEISDAIKARLAGNLNEIQERGVTAIDADDEVAKLERYPGEVKTWQYEGAEGLSITIEGTEEYYHHVSSVLDELAADTEMGEKLQQALEGKPFSIHFPKEVEHDGISVHPASIDLDNNIIYFDPLNTLSHDSESGGGDQPKLTLAHELIHRLDKDNLRRDDDTQPFTAEEKSLLEAMAVGATYKTPDGQEVDFSDPEVKKKYLKEGAPIFTVNQLRDELGIEERLEYTEGDNSAEGRLHFQHPGNSNLKTEVSLYRSWKTLEKQTEETERDYNNSFWPHKYIPLKNKLNRLRAQLEVVNNQIARFKGEVPNIERLAFAKLWLAEAKAGTDSHEETIAEQYLEHVNWNIEQGWNAELDQEYSRDSDSRVLTVDEFKRETIEELRAAYFTGDRVKAYALILSKLESVNEKLENRDWEDEEELQALLEQKNILTNAEATFINQATSPGIPEVRYLFLPGNVEDIEAAARSYYENMDSLVLPDGTVVTPEEQRALIDMYGGPEEFAEHMRMAHEHNKALSMSETLTPDQFLLMIAERTLEENGRLPPEGIDASFLDKKIMVRFDHVKRTWTSGDDFEQDEWSTEKEFTAREILLGKHKQYAKSLSPAAGNGHCSVASMTSSDQEIAGLERELGSVRVQNEYMDHVDDLKGNSQFMDALQHRLKTQLYQRLTDLGADKGQLVTVGIDHQPDSLAGHSGRLNMNSVFAIRNDDGTFTFFSLLTDKTFTTTKVDESAWENERKGEIEAQGWLKDPSSEFNKFMSAHIDPKERFSASDYELKLDFFDRGAVLNQRCEELGLNQGDLVDVGINYQPDSHTINRGPLGMDSVFAVKNDDGTLTFFSLYSDETFTTTKVDDEDSWRNEQQGMAEAHRALRDPKSKFHSFMTAHIVPEESSYKLQLDLAGHQSEELSQRREELGLNQGDLVSVGINDQQDGHFGHSRRLNMDSVFAVRNDDGTLTFFSQSSDETYTTTKVDDENSWRNEQEGMKEAYYWLRDPNSEFYRFMSAHIEPEDRLSSLGHDLSGYDLRLNLVDHQNEDALLGKNTENFMDFMKNWMDVNSRSEGEEVIEAFSFWVNELGKAWTAATDFLPLPIKFMARMGFTIVQGSLNMANTETIAERDEAGRNMGYSMGKVTAFSAASGTANPKAMTNFKVFPGPTPADKVFTAREHTANVIGRGPVATGTQWGGAPSADDRIRSTFKDPDKGYTPASQPTAATKPNEVLDFGTTDEIWSRMMNGEPQSFETVPEPQSETRPTTLASFLQTGRSTNQGNPDYGTMENPRTSWGEETQVGQIHVYHNPKTGTIDYFEAQFNGRATEQNRYYFPQDRSSNQYWKYMGGTQGS